MVFPKFKIAADAVVGFTALSDKATSADDFLDGKAINFVVRFFFSKVSREGIALFHFVGFHVFPSGIASSGRG